MIYRKHLFFCTNKRTNGRSCCEDKNASDLYAYAKTKVRELGLSDIRVNQSGCLGQCDYGPSLVIYPEGVWYSYHNAKDIDRIIDSHLLSDEIVQDLLMKHV